MTIEKIDHPIQAALKEILAEKQDHVAGSIAHQRMERAAAALRSVQLPLSPAMCALIESGQEEDDDAGWLAEHQTRKAGLLPQEGQSSAEELAKDMSRPMVDITPPASLRDRDMYEQGRLAERDPRTPGSLASQLALPAGTFQQRVQPWMMACFGETISNDLQERNHRFLEEALELVQSTGCTQSEAHQLVDYVFGRPVGEPAQEVGGVMVTLAALCLAAKMDMHAAGETELARIWTKVDQIRAKQAAKPKHSPLPVALPAWPVPELAPCGTPTSKGIYAWIADAGAALVMVNKSPSDHSPGGVLNGHAMDSTRFYDGCPVTEWRTGKWFGPLKSYEPARAAPCQPAEEVQPAPDELQAIFRKAVFDQGFAIINRLMKAFTQSEDLRADGDVKAAIHDAMNMAGELTRAARACGYEPPLQTGCSYETWPGCDTQKRPYALPWKKVQPEEVSILNPKAEEGGAS